MIRELVTKQNKRMVRLLNLRKALVDESNIKEPQCRDHQLLTLYFFWISTRL